MEFYSKRYRVTFVKAYTQAQGFKNVKVGDHLKCKITLRDTTGACKGRLYATQVSIMHEESGMYWENPSNRFLNNIANFSLTEEELPVE